MKTLLISVKFLMVTVIILLSQEAKIGDKAPEFTAVSDSGETWNSKDFVGKKNVIVYFFPAAMTGGCTAQACAYRDFSSDLGDMDAIVIGVSGDNVEGLKIFKKTQNLNFTLLSDEKGEIAKKFGVPTREGGTISREIDGQTFQLTRGITASRWTFIIDKTGNIVYINEQVDASKDSEQVLNYLKNNS